ncbi:MAG: alpha/beta hydrolase [Lachnospiraceae bacterium]|nr:alpha/beta hydrolase [Lachnospiraceae bacterium]
MIIPILLIALFILFFATLFGFYFFAFCHPKHARPKPKEIPPDSIYNPYREHLLTWIEDMETTPNELVQTKAFDGKKLFAHLYVFSPDAPLVIFSHGYHGIYCRDGYGMYRVCKKHGYNILMMDARAHGQSTGDITFGIRERHDFKTWVDYSINHFGPDVKIILAGVSMGAASMMMSTTLNLPANVKGLVEDCGYSEPAAIIKKTILEMHLPLNPFYGIVKLSAKIFGGIDLEETSALEAVSKLQIPLMLIHGDKDHVVPPPMCKELYECCSSKKKMVTFEHATHANNALSDFDLYEKEVLQFIKEALA